ncbi:phage tail protein [Ralstonia flatus]|uniref:Phage tail fibre protein N-terminal domain-containing protein n=1 Tax=Ralstonia flatus TaxID=3058601 RepID=A0AAD2BVV4_9RALS|nr:phage tail protein [Ralstonia sp. LMG 32965]MBN6211198.1 phage tail protein [Ralstonia pickettii]CAJ0859592.1 hypothetical protein R77567_01379 [Ralstonia sp. LMG 32965]CAJ0867642.1 hypothetical protein R77564_01396 [Ralstonia sp. LMG 32965]
MAKYFAMLTEAGEAKMARALVSNTMVPLTEMAVGDGGIDGGTDADVTPSIEQRALVRERLRRPLNRLVTDPKNPSIVIAEIYLPEEVGGWWVRELGLFDEDGELFAVANVPPSYKPILAEGSGRGQFYRMMLIHKAAGNIALQVDPSIVVATREYVDEQVTAVRTAVTGENDKRYATKESVEQLQGAVDEARELAFDALPRSGGEMTGPIDMTGPSNELRFTDSQQPLTIGRFRMGSSNGQLVFDRNTSPDGSFASFSRLYWVDGNGNFVVPGMLTAASVKTQSNVNLPAYNNDGRGFLEFGGDTVIWRMFMVGPNGNLVLNGYNADGTNRSQPFYVDYASGKMMFAVRPVFCGATPYDTNNLKDPLTADGGMLAEGKGLIFGATYGSSPLRVGALWGTSNLGGAYLEWNQTRTPALRSTHQAWAPPIWASAGHSGERAIWRQSTAIRAAVRPARRAFPSTSATARSRGVLTKTTSPDGTAAMSGARGTSTPAARRPPIPSANGTRPSPNSERSRPANRPAPPTCRLPMCSSACATPSTCITSAR